MMCFVDKVTTSIKISKKIWKKAKIQAIVEDIDLSELIKKCILDWIKLPLKERKRLQKKYDFINL